MTYQMFKPKTPHPGLLSALQAAVPDLPDSDKGFALSLCDGHIKYGGWSDKQALWAQKMVDKAKAATANPLSADGVAALAAVASLPPVIDNGPAPVATEAEMAGVIAVFAKAAAHLKYPSIQLALPSSQQYGAKGFVVKKAKNHGGLNVVSGTSYPNKWYGKITEDGKFSPKYGLNQPLVDAITVALKEFAADPAGVAAKYGKLHGSCCFCNKGLTDPKSTSVGYGPICAGHYGLPWGTVGADNLSSGAAALKAMAKKVVADPSVLNINGIPNNPLFKLPDGQLKSELQQIAKEAKADPGEKVMPVLTAEEYARLKARVEVLF